MTQAVLHAHMTKVAPTPENGTDFYKLFFTEDPDARGYFKGAETIDPGAVIGNARFQTLGSKLITTMNTLVDHYGSDFETLVKNHITDHTARFKIPMKHYVAVVGIWQKFMEQKAGMTAEQKAAWGEFFAKFAKIAEPLAA